MDLPWDKSLVPKYQPWYYSVTYYKYYLILGKHNDRVIMDFIGKGRDDEEYESVNKCLFCGLVKNTDQTIQVGSIGAIDDDNLNLHGYYTV